MSKAAKVALFDLFNLFERLIWLYFFRVGAEGQGMKTESRGNEDWGLRKTKTLFLKGGYW